MGQGSVAEGRRWWRRRDSNPGPDDYDSSALPAELRRHDIGQDAPGAPLWARAHKAHHLGVPPQRCQDWSPLRRRADGAREPPAPDLGASAVAHHQRRLRQKAAASVEPAASLTPSRAPSYTARQAGARRLLPGCQHPALSFSSGDGGSRGKCWDSRRGCGGISFEERRPDQPARRQTPRSRLPRRPG